MRSLLWLWRTLGKNEAIQANLPPHPSPPTPTHAPHTHPPTYTGQADTMKDPFPHEGQRQQQRCAAKRPVEGPAGGAEKHEGSMARGDSPPCLTRPAPPPEQPQQQQQEDKEEEEEEQQQQQQQQQQSKRARSNAAATILTTCSASTSTLIVIEDSSDDEKEDEEQQNEEEDDGTEPKLAAFAALAAPIPMPPSRRHHPRLHALFASSSSSTSSSSSSTTFFELPSLIIVDLDDTIWRGNVSDQLPPFTLSNHPDHVHVRGVFGSSGWGRGPGGGGGGGGGGGPSIFRLFPEAREVLSALHGTGSTTLAVASRSPNTQAAVHMLQLMKLHTLFLSSSSSSTLSLSSSSSSTVLVEEGREDNGESKEMLMHISNEGFGKTKHLREILRSAKAEAHQVLFFDDQKVNLQDARKLGCCAQAVTSTEGLSWAALESGLRSYREQGRARQMMNKLFVKK